jgi:hypothetical protein
MKIILWRFESFTLFGFRMMGGAVQLRIAAPLMLCRLLRVVWNRDIAALYPSHKLCMCHECRDHKQEHVCERSHKKCGALISVGTTSVVILIKPLHLLSRIHPNPHG